jgi:hypothetical protein
VASLFAEDGVWKSDSHGVGAPTPFARPF